MISSAGLHLSSLTTLAHPASSPPTAKGMTNMKFPTRKPIVLLHLSGNVVRTTADHPFYVHGQGWTDAADLHVGDKLRSSDGQDVPLDAITDQSEAAVVYRMDAAVPPFPCTGLWPAGTLLATADGPKAIEDIRPGITSSSARRSLLSETDGPGGHAGRSPFKQKPTVG